MENWIFYALIAAILIGSRDIFTTSFTKKYTYSQHLLHYYVLCGLVIVIYCLFRKNIYKENNFKMIDKGDIWKYILIAIITVIIISPCMYESLRLSDNPGKAKAVINLNTIVVFFISYLFLRSVKIEMKSILGVFFIVIGIYLII
jgi:drug/metabolite transporter (DMT)-like permease